MDKTVDCLNQIKAYADEHGVDVERVEVAMRDDIVSFEAFLKPKPLAMEKVCVSYSRSKGDAVPDEAN